MEDLTNVLMCDKTMIMDFINFMYHQRLALTNINAHSLQHFYANCIDKI